MSGLSKASVTDMKNEACDTNTLPAWTEPVNLEHAKVMLLAKAAVARAAICWTG